MGSETRTADPAPRSTAHRPAGHPGPHVRHQRPALLPATVGINPEHPYWVPEFVGDTIVVNGKVWPTSTVEPQALPLPASSTARTPAPTSCSWSTRRPRPMGPAMWVDRHRRRLPRRARQDRSERASGQSSWCIMPGERYDVIIDFARPGAPAPTLILRNTARAPYPGRAPPRRVDTAAGSSSSASARRPVDDTATTRRSGAIRCGRPAASCASPTLRRHARGGRHAAKTRQLTLNEVMGMPRSTVRAWPIRAARWRSWSTTPKWDGSPAPPTCTPAGSRPDHGMQHDYSELPQRRRHRGLGDRQPDGRRPPDPPAPGPVPDAQPAELQHQQIQQGLQRCRSRTRPSIR